MPREKPYIHDVIAHAAASAVARIMGLVNRSIDTAVAEQLGSRAAKAKAVPRRRTAARRREITRWVADRRARRVPKFVIEATGLDTKKKIVAKYGENAAFGWGKPLPKAVASGGSPKARPPAVRKAAAKQRLTG